jgi:hypothetical protein
MTRRFGETAGQTAGCLLSEVDHLTTLSVSKLYSVDGRIDGGSGLGNWQRREPAQCHMLHLMLRMS